MFGEAWNEHIAELIGFFGDSSSDKQELMVIKYGGGDEDCIIPVL